MIIDSPWIPFQVLRKKTGGSKIFISPCGSMPNLSEKTRDFCSMKPTYELDLHGLVSIDLLRKSGSFCCVFFFSYLFHYCLKFNWSRLFLEEFVSCFLNVGKFEESHVHLDPLRNTSFMKTFMTETPPFLEGKTCSNSACSPFHRLFSAENRWATIWNNGQAFWSVLYGGGGDTWRIIPARKW